MQTNVTIIAGFVGPPGDQGEPGVPSTPGVIVATIYLQITIFGYHNNGGPNDTMVSISAGPLTLSGHQLALGDTVLVNRGTIIANGLYVVTNDGSDGSAVVMTRDPRMVTNAQIQNTVVYISNLDSTNPYSSWLCATPGPVTVGTTAYTFKKLSNDFELTANIPNPSVGTYILRGSAVRAGGFTNVLFAQTAAGSVTASLVQGGTLSGGVVTGGTTVTNFPTTITTTPQTALLTTPIASGELTALVISGVSGASGLVLTVSGANR